MKIASGTIIKIYISLALISLFIMFAGFRALLESPYTGLHFEQRSDKWYISSVDSGSPASVYPELSGAEVTEIAGRQLKPGDMARELNTEIVKQSELLNLIEGQKYFNANIHINKPFTIVFIPKQTDSLRSCQLTPIKYPFRLLLQKTWLLLSCALITLIVVTLILIKKPDDGIVRLYAALAYCTAFVDIVYIISVTKDILILFPVYVMIDVVNNISTFALALFFLHFTAVFPLRKKILDTPFLLPIVYLVAIAGCLIYMTRISFYPYSILLLLYTAAGFVFMVHSYLTLQSPLQKAQVRLTMIALGMCSAIFIFFYLGPLALSYNNVSAYWPMVSTVVVPIALAFAIMRYRLMDIETLFDNTLIYSVTIGFLAMIDVVIVYILTSNQIPLLVFKEPFPTIIAVWVIIFAYLPVRNRVRDFIRRLLKREMYDMNEVLSSYSKKLISANSAGDAVQLARETVSSALHPKTIEIELSGHGDLKSLYNNDAGGAVIPLALQSGPVGVMILGEKHSGRLYDHNDIKLLDMIAHQTALAIESIRQREEIRRKEDEARREKERIGREIHDGIGSSLVQVKLLLERSIDPLRTIEELKPVINTGISDMRELIWVVDQEEETLDDLVFYIEELLNKIKNNISITIDTDISDGNITLSPEKRLHLVRIVQEAVTNIIKHAEATEINASFVQQEEKLIITISDNGKGFDAGICRAGGHGLRNMRKRCDEIGAELSISSEPGKGAEIRLSVDIGKSF